MDNDSVQESPIYQIERTKNMTDYKNELSKLLIKLNLSPALYGYDLIIEAVNMYCNRPKNQRFSMTDTYRRIAAKTKPGTVSHVERCIRTAITSMFLHNTTHVNDDLIKEIFGDNAFLSDHISNAAFVACLGIYLTTHTVKDI